MAKLSLALACLFIVAQGFQWVTQNAMPTPRSDMTASLVGNSIYVTGGCSMDQLCPGNQTFCFCQGITNSTEAFNAVTGNWTVLADMPIPRYRHASVVVGTDIYVIGGRDINDNIIQQVDIYHTTTNRWETSAASWANATSDLTAVAIGTVIYASGGYTADYAAVTSTSVLDTAVSGTAWNFGNVSAMNEARGDCCSVYLDGKIWVFGGFDFTNFCKALNTLEVYDPASNKWEMKAALHFPRGDSACAALHGKFHAIAGEQKDNVTGCSKFDIPINDVEAYDPVNDTWSEETPIPQNRFRFAAETYNNTLYIFGGQGSRNNETYPVLSSVLSFTDVVVTTTTSTTSVATSGTTTSGSTTSGSTTSVATTTGKNNSDATKTSFGYALVILLCALFFM